MPPYLSLNKNTPGRTPFGHRCHPLEDPLNWPEQRDFTRFFEAMRAVGQYFRRALSKTKPAAKIAAGSQENPQDSPISDLKPVIHP